MATFVLIHGAWHGGWCWERLVPELEALGHAAHAPDLPGHGDDPAPPAAVTMDDYVARITGALRDAPEPAILVGHSMGGMPISAAAEALPERVRALAYVCAFLPRDGESLGAIEGRNPRPLVPPHISEEDGALVVDPAQRRALFYGDVPEAVADEAMRRLTPQPPEPFGAAVTLSDERFGQTPKHYVACTRDGAISIELQRDMAAATPSVTVHALDADHSPFLSCPADLARVLDGVARA